MKYNIYEYLDHVEFITDLIENRPFKGRGERKRLADILNCQMAFITHVLNGEKNFSHEQILKIAHHFNLNESEKDFLLEMLSYNRAGTKELQEFYKKKLLQKREEHKLLKNRLQETQSLSVQDQAEYYSHWLYGAIHMASTVPAMQTIKAMAQHFNIDEKEVLHIVEFLSLKGLVLLENGKVTPGQSHLYVDKDSPLLNQHHSIWRLKALHDLKTNKKDDFHYSLCFSVSEKDWPVIRETMIQAINDCLKVIRPSKEEKLGLICMDFQEV